MVGHFECLGHEVTLGLIQSGRVLQEICEVGLWVVLGGHQSRSVVLQAGDRLVDPGQSGPFGHYGAIELRHGLVFAVTCLFDGGLVRDLGLVGRCLDLLEEVDDGLLVELVLCGHESAFGGGCLGLGLLFEDGGVELLGLCFGGVLASEVGLKVRQH